MKAKLKTDSTGCPVELLTFVKENAEWIAEAKTSKSASTRTRIVREHILNHETVSRDMTWVVIHQLYEATELCEKGIRL